MNTYSKYVPNVYLARCKEKQEKGSFIMVQTKYGKENECEVHNLIYEGNGFFFYSITRTDGWNAQEWAKAKAERLNGWAASAEKRSTQYYEASQEGKDFLSLGEPIKVGHHSERRHRALIDRNWERMGKCVAESDKAKDYENRASYWEAKTEEVNLSMPESVEYFEYLVEKLEKKHAALKADPDKRGHTFSLTYAKKDWNNAVKNLKLAHLLWD